MWHRFAGTDPFETPFVTALVEIDATGIRLPGVVENEDAAIAIGSAVTGRATTTDIGGLAIPALRWRVV